MKIALGMAVLMLAVSVAVSAGEGGGGGGPGGGGPGGGGPGGGKRPPPGMLIKVALDHKDELKLTADQVTKLEALQKDHKPGDKPPGGGGGAGGPPPRGGGGDGAGGPPRGGKPGDGGPLKGILTEEQMTKLKELMKAEHPGGPGGGPKPQQ